LFEKEDVVVIVVVGSGKLARELLLELPALCTSPVFPWEQRPEGLPVVVVHAGSGRELEEVVRYCRENGSVLVELATGSGIESLAQGFPLVLCPNTNILMLKVMSMLAASGPLFRNHPVHLSESHQAAKTSLPGTAVHLAESLGIPVPEIVSIRDPLVQEKELGIPPEHLGRHAFHRIEIGDESTRVVLETRVTGDAPYADGVSRIIAAIAAHPLEPRVYPVTEFVELGWI
jgi:dihydrodipicolinate reductase